MTTEHTNFLDYLSKEEHNLLVSIVNLRLDIDVFAMLDNIYKIPLKNIEIKESEAVIPSLYLFVHFHFYFSISCILRAHITEGLASLRKAIDASLTAYKIQEEPESEESYLKRVWLFQNIKKHIKKSREKDSSLFPLAESLIPMHETCSEYGSHADFSALEHRIDVYDIKDSSKKKLIFKYFDYPEDSDMYHCIFVDILLCFHKMLLIFQPYMSTKLGKEKGKWGEDMKKIGDALVKEQESCHKHLQGAREAQQGA